MLLLLYYDDQCYDYESYYDFCYYCGCCRHHCYYCYYASLLLL